MALAKRGIHVTGVDRTAAFLERAKALAESGGVDVEWVHGDVRDFVRPEAYDLVISMFTSFGYFEIPEDDARVLRNAFASLRPSGAILLELMGKELIARRFRDTTCTRSSDGSLLVELHRIRDGWEEIENEWVLVRDGTTKTFRFSHRIYSGAELRELLREAGFSRVRLFGDLEGSEYGAEAKRLIVVGEKVDAGQG